MTLHIDTDIYLLVLLLSLSLGGFVGFIIGFVVGLFIDKPQEERRENMNDV